MESASRIGWFGRALRRTRVAAAALDNFVGCDNICLPEVDNLAAGVRKMLFHVTMTHTEDECPGYNRDKMPEVLAAAENLDSVAAELGANILFNVSGAPEHVGFMLVEAENPYLIARIVTTIPYKQSFKVTAVLGEAELIESARRMMASGQAS